jgi:hypothetical protein
LWYDLLEPPECRKLFTISKTVLDLVFIVVADSVCFVAGKDDGVGRTRGKSETKYTCSDNRLDHSNASIRSPGSFYTVFILSAQASTYQAITLRICFAAQQIAPL